MFGSLITAIVTPFTDDHRIHFDEALRLAQHLLDTGSDGLVVCGTTGESPTLTHQEEDELFAVMRRTFPTACLIAGSGSNCTQTAIKATQAAEKRGMNGSMQVVPYYNRPSQEGLIAHFTAIANATSLPLMLYNIPARTGRNMTPETVATLASIPSIVALKEAAGDCEQLKQMVALTPPSFLVYSGDDGMIIPFMAEGAVGVVSVAAHVVGREIRSIVDAMLQGNHSEAKQQYARIHALVEALFMEPNPTPLKYVLQQMGFQVGSPRLPLVPVQDATRRTLDTILATLSIG